MGLASSASNKSAADQTKKRHTAYKVNQVTNVHFQILTSYESTSICLVRTDKTQLVGPVNGVVKFAAYGIKMTSLFF